MTIKAMILSDLHLGSHDGVLGFAAAQAAGQTHKAYLKQRLFDKLRAALGSDTGAQRFLVLNGDTLDFSLQNYAAAFAEGQSFFRTLAAENLFDEIIFIAGNHDHNVWQMAQQETLVVDQLRKGKLPHDFEHVRDALLDLKTNRLIIPGVTDVTAAASSDSFFIQGLFGPAPAKMPKLWVVYPNLFIQPAVEESHEARPILVTHGHFFSLPWVLVTTVFPKSLQIDGCCTLEQLEQLNSPLTEMAWTALGQAGTLTDLAHRIYGAVAKGEMGLAQKVIDEFGNYIDNEVWKGGAWNPKEWVTDAVIKGIKKFLLYLIEKGVESGDNHKDDQTFLDDGDNQKRIRLYLGLSRAQYSDLLKKCGLDWRAGMPQQVVFGHTHSVIKPPRSGPFSWAWGAEIQNTGGFMKDVRKVAATAVIVDLHGRVASIPMW